MYTGSMKVTMAVKYYGKTSVIKQSRKHQKKHQRTSKKLGRPIEPVFVGSYYTEDGILHPAKLYTGGIGEIAKACGVSTNALYHYLQTSSLEDIMSGNVHKRGQKHLPCHPRLAGCKYSTIKANVLENGGTLAQVAQLYKTNGDCYNNKVSVAPVAMLVQTLETEAS